MDNISSHINGADDLMNCGEESSVINEITKADVVYLMMSGCLHQISGVQNSYGDILDLDFFSNPNSAKVCGCHELLSRAELYHCDLFALSTTLTTRVNQTCLVSSTPLINVSISDRFF